jgi:hypothetical protein
MIGGKTEPQIKSIDSNNYTGNQLSIPNISDEHIMELGRQSYQGQFARQQKQKPYQNVMLRKPFTEKYFNCGEYGHSFAKCNKSGKPNPPNLGKRNLDTLNASGQRQPVTKQRRSNSWAPRGANVQSTPRFNAHAGFLPVDQGGGADLFDQQTVIEVCEHFQGHVGTLLDISSDIVNNNPEDAAWDYDDF